MEMGKFEQYERVMCIYLTVPLVIVGIGVNVAAACLLGRDETLRDNSRFLLRALAIADVVFLLTCVTSDTIPTVVSSSDWVSNTAFEGFWYSVGSHLWPAKHVALVSTTWLVVGITFDQYSTTTTTESRTFLCAITSVTHRAAAVLCVWIGSMVFNLPRFFGLNGAVYVFVYDLLCHAFVAFVSPYVLLGVWTHRLFGRVVQPQPNAPSDADASRSLNVVDQLDNASSSSPPPVTGSRQRRATMIVIVIVGAMFVCRAPSFVTYIYGFPFRLELSWSGSYDEEFIAFEYLTVFTDFLLVVNSASRFVDYLTPRRSSERNGVGADQVLVELHVDISGETNRT